MKRIAYIRALDEEGRKQQLDALTPLSDVRAIDTTADALGLPRIIEQLDEGDVLVIASIDRLGPRFGELLLGVLECATIEVHNEGNTLTIDDETWAALGECSKLSSFDAVAAYNARGVTVVDRQRFKPVADLAAALIKAIGALDAEAARRGHAIH